MEPNKSNTRQTEQHLNSFIRFLELVEIPRFRKNFRYILFHYLMTEHEELMPDFKWFIEDMRFFFEFLDELEPRETEPPTWIKIGHITRASMNDLTAWKDD